MPDPQKETPQVNQDVVTWVRGRLGQQVGRGECWDLAETALSNSGARLSASFGPVTDNADYVWGTPVTDLRQLKPGDIIQMRNFTETDLGRVDVTFADGSGWTDEGGADTTRPHHTAIVDRAPDANGLVVILEQNYGEIGRRVQRNTIHLRNFERDPVTTHETRTRDDNGASERATVVTKVKWQVAGTLWAYRPVAL